MMDIYDVITGIVVCGMVLLLWLIFEYNHSPEKTDAYVACVNKNLGSDLIDEVKKTCYWKIHAK